MNDGRTPTQELWRRFCMYEEAHPPGIGDEEEGRRDYYCELRLDNLGYGAIWQGRDDVVFSSHEQAIKLLEDYTSSEDDRVYASSQQFERIYALFQALCLLMTFEKRAPSILFTFEGSGHIKVKHAETNFYSFPEAILWLENEILEWGDK